MKKLSFGIFAVALFAALGIAIDAHAFGPATNQVWSAPLDNTGTNVAAEITANGDIKVAGTVTALGSQTAPSATVGALTVQTNATIGGTLAVTGSVSVVGNATFTTNIIFLKRATTAPTNTVAAGLQITVNGTNYIVELKKN